MILNRELLQKLNSKELELIKSGTLNKIILNDFDPNSSLKKFDEMLRSNLEVLKPFKSGLLFSGGIDSSILAFKMKELGLNFNAILVANEKEQDYKNAIEVSKELNLNLVEIKLTFEELESLIPKIMKIISTTEEKEVNIAIPFTLAANYLKKNDFDVAVLGQCADELFGGYQRHVDYLKEKPNQFKEYHLIDIVESTLRNHARDNAIFSSVGIKMYLPYFTEGIIKLALSLPTNLLIQHETEPPIKKVFLRNYVKNLGLSKNIREKKKVAVQFGSGSYKMLRKLALKRGFTKDFSQKHRYRRHVQLYLDFIAQKNGIANLGLKLKEIANELNIPIEQ
ncbi:MAG: asparagine synthase C-terminal domain-containing protein [Candidatus Helarchaeota archaeon]